MRTSQPTTHLSFAPTAWRCALLSDDDDTICSDLQKWTELEPVVYALGIHYPNSRTSSACAASNKRLWASEDFSSLFTAGGCWARLLNRNYALANMTSTIAWNLIAAYYDALPYAGDALMHAPEPWSGFYELGQVFWATAHTTQFTSIGWRYLAHGAGVGVLDGGGSYVSLTDSQGNLTIVVETMSFENSGCVHENAPRNPVTLQNVTFQLEDGFAQLKSLHVFYSAFDNSTTDYFRYLGSMPVTNGSIQLQVAPNVLYTLSTLNGTKGSFDEPPPARKAFPFPYADDFNSYELASQATYVTDQAGSYEVVAAADVSRGKVLRQMVPRRPVSWCTEAPLTYTIVGDYAWSTVRAEVDALIEEQGTVFLAAAVSMGGCVWGAGTPAIVFALSSTGAWTVANNTDLKAPLAQGKVTVSSGTWYHLEVDVAAGGTTVWLDGKQVAMVPQLSSDRHHGWIGLGSSYDFVQFDRLSINRSNQRVLPPTVASVYME